MFDSFESFSNSFNSLPKVTSHFNNNRNNSNAFSKYISDIDSFNKKSQNKILQKYNTNQMEYSEEDDDDDDDKEEEEEIVQNHFDIDEKKEEKPSTYLSASGINFGEKKEIFSDQEKNSFMSLKEKLFELYTSEKRKSEDKKEKEEHTTANDLLQHFLSINSTSKLLDKLMKKSNANYNTLVLNFTQQGFTIGFNVRERQRNHLSKLVLLHDLREAKTKKLDCEGELEEEENVNVISNDVDMRMVKEKEEINLLDDEEVKRLSSLQTKLIDYSESEILFYVNCGEIPPILIDIIDRVNFNLFYDGCIILEIRDYRRLSRIPINSNEDHDDHYSYEINYVLLQPSMQTLLCDLNSITNDGNYIWTQEDKYALESQLVLHTSPPLCLDPRLVVSLVKNNLLAHKNKLNDRRLKRAAKRFSSHLNLTPQQKQQKTHQFHLPFPFHILKIRKKYSTDNQQQQIKSTTSINIHESTNKINAKIHLKSPQSQRILQSVDNWCKSSSLSPTFKLPRDDMILVKKFSTKHHHHHMNKSSLSSSKSSSCQDDATSTSSTPIIVDLDRQPLNPLEEFVLEACDRTSKNNYSRLLIKKRPADGIYFCQLSLKPPSSPLDSSSTLDTQFRLGLVGDAEKYIQQYVKIFSEDGRRPVTIKHNLIHSTHTNNVNSNNEQNYSQSVFSAFKQNQQQQQQQTRQSPLIRSGAISHENLFYDTSSSSVQTTNSSTSSNFNNNCSNFSSSSPPQHSSTATSRLNNIINTTPSSTWTTNTNTNTNEYSSSDNATTTTTSGGGAMMMMMRCHDKQLQAYQTFLHQQQQQIIMKKQQLEQEQLKAHLHQQQLNNNLLNQIKRIKAAASVSSSSSNDNQFQTQCHQSSNNNQRVQHQSNTIKPTMLDSITETILNTSKLATLDVEANTNNKVFVASNEESSQSAVSEFSKPLSIQSMPPPQKSPSKLLSYTSVSIPSPISNINRVAQKSIVQAKVNQNNNNNVMIKMHGLNNFHHQQQNHNTNINLFRKIAPIDSNLSSLNTTAATRPPIIVTLNPTNNLNLNQQKNFFSNPMTSSSSRPIQAPQSTTATIIINKNMNEEKGQQQQN